MARHLVKNEQLSAQHKNKKNPVEHGDDVTLLFFESMESQISLC